MADEPHAFYREFRPSLWQRICWWSGWPWAIRAIKREERVWGTAPYLVTVQENDVWIGWHPVESIDGMSTGLILSRWGALANVIRPRRYEVHVGSDPAWLPEPRVEEATE